MSFSDMIESRVEAGVSPMTDFGPGTQEEIPVEGGEEATAEEQVETGHFLENERAGQSLVDQGIGIMVAVIVVGAVAIPVSVEVLNNLSVGGTTGQILGYVPLALGVGLFVAAISIVR